jgi:putative ABC transport system permease protein
MAMTVNGRSLLRLGDYPEFVEVTSATTNLFKLLGVQPVLGRVFSPEESYPGRAGEVAMLGYDYWRERFHGDPSVLGRLLDLGGHRVAVVGVLQPGFKFTYPKPVQVWQPLPENRAVPRGFGGGLVTARLKPGVTPAQAEAGMRAVIAGLAHEYPASNRELAEVRVISILGWTTGRIKSTLLMLIGAAGFLLLIGCSNVANMFLARLIDRERETSLRAALGASRWRIVKELLAESLLISLAAGVFGLLLCWLGVDLLRNLLPPELPRGDEVRLDMNVAAFALGLSAATALVFGLVPALKCSKVNLIEGLAGSPSSTNTGRGKGFRATLVAAETALSLVLLSGAGLMMYSVVQLIHVDLGIDPKDVLAANVSLDPYESPTLDSRRALLEDMLDAVRGVRGVRQVGAVDVPPLLGGGEAIIGLRLRPGLPPATIRSKFVAGDYFGAMRIPLLEGRVFTQMDRDRTEQVTVVNKSLARLIVPDARAVGRHLYSGNNAIRIVGVVADGRNRLLFSPEPEVYLPVGQAPLVPHVIVVRYNVMERARVNGAVRGALLKLAPQRIVSINSFEESVAQQGAQLRFLTMLIGAAGLLGLLLGASGLFGVTAYAVRRRRRELGIRLALGAAPNEVLQMILRESAGMAAVGVVLGIPIVLALRSVLRSLLFEVSPSDPLTLAAVIAVLGGAGVAASWIPARKVLSIDPAVALRHE